MSEGASDPYLHAVPEHDPMLATARIVLAAPQSELEAPAKPRPLAKVARAIGNRRAGALLGRAPGDGLLAGGAVHPDVEAAIATSRGSGSTLHEPLRRRFADRLGDPLGDVRIHTDSRAHSLTTAVAARAFATGRDVYFAPGEYRPGTQDGDHLIAHELAHVMQQRGAPVSGPLTVTEPGDQTEREADDVALTRSPTDFEFVEVRIREAVLAATDQDLDDPHRGLYVSDDQAMALAISAGLTHHDERLGAAVERLGLDAMEAAVLALCAAPELDPRFGRLFAFLQDDATKQLATPSFASRLLGVDGHHAAAGAARLRP